MRYELVGNPSAQQYLGIEADTGGLYVKRDLRTTHLTRFTAEIRAVDGGGRSSNPNAFISVSVDHNNFAPQFPDGSCDRTVSASGVGTVITLRATDDDRGNLSSNKVMRTVLKYVMDKCMCYLQCI